MTLKVTLKKHLTSYRVLGLLFVWGYALFVMARYTSLGYFVAFALESLVLTMAIVLLAAWTRMPSWLEKLLLFVLFGLYLASMDYMRQAGIYVDRLALGNAAKVTSLGLPYYFILSLLVSVLLALLSPKSFMITRLKQWMLLTAIFALVLTGLSYRAIVMKQGKTLGIPPLIYFADTLAAVMEKPSYALPEKEVKRLLAELHQDKVYQQKDHPLLVDRPKKPNVIIFFTEGMSAELMGAYGGAYHDLTPNLDAFARRSIKVENYYNHSLATIRGIRGQLLSAHQYYQDVYNVVTDEDKMALKATLKTPLISLPQILNQYNYQTGFITPHQNVDSLNPLLSELGFDQVYARSAFDQVFPNATWSHQDWSPRDHEIPDRMLMNFLIKILEDQKDNVDQPFMMGIYNFGTHTGGE
jgi:glucan phosphoethanolaminetransferase (alkaline phosphatase superfamily)